MDTPVRRCVLLQIVLPCACLFSILQVDTVPTLGLLIFDYRHVRIAGGGGWGGGGVVFLEPARTERRPPRLSGLASGYSFYQFGIMASS